MFKRLLIEYLLLYIKDLEAITVPITAYFGPTTLYGGGGRRQKFFLMKIWYFDMIISQWILIRLYCLIAHFVDINILFHNIYSILLNKFILYWKFSYINIIIIYWYHCFIIISWIKNFSSEDFSSELQIYYMYVKNDENYYRSLYRSTRSRYSILPTLNLLHSPMISME